MKMRGWPPPCGRARLLDAYALARIAVVLSKYHSPKVQEIALLEAATIQCDDQ